MMGTFAQWILGLLLIIGGLGYAWVRTVADGMGDPNPGPLGGWLPVLAGVAAAGVGLAVILVH